MTISTARQRDGRSVTIIDSPKGGMSVFTVFGWVEGDAQKPCHWTATGAYRMDGQPDPRDLVYHDGLQAKADARDMAFLAYSQPNGILF